MDIFEKISKLHLVYFLYQTFQSPVSDVVACEITVVTNN